MANIVSEYGRWLPVHELIKGSSKEQGSFLDAWSKENDRLTRELGMSHDVLAVRIENGSFQVRVQGIAGTINIAGQTIQIVPKCFSQHTHHWERSLLRMLSFAESLHFELSAPMSVDADVTDVIDHLAYAFVIALELAIHSGPLLIYQEQEILSPYARGRLRLEPITERLAYPHLLRCIVEEMVADNPYTSLLCWALEAFQRAVRKPMLRVRLQNLHSNFIGIVPRRLPPAILDHLHLPLQYKQYSRAVSIARWLARGETVGQLAGNWIGGGLVLDMSQVFERFVSNCLRVVASRRGTGVTAYTLSQESDLLAEEIDGGSPFYTRPDERLILNGHLSLLVDAKYKGRNGNNPADFLRIDRDDLYQMIASCTAAGCSHVLLVYPATSESDSSWSRYRRWQVRNQLGGENITVTAAALALQELATVNIDGVIDALDRAVTEAINDP